MSIMKAYFILATGIILAGILCVKIEPSLREPPNAVIRESPVIEPEVSTDIFVGAERVTGCPAEILRGIAGVESYFEAAAVGDEGRSQGMFQLHSRWHDSRVKKYGEFDPFDPADAAVIAGYVIQENLRAFDGNLRLAIAAYKQGVNGVIQNGCIDWYVDAVLGWRKNSGMLLAFSVFQGITESGRLEDGRFDFGAQVAYQPDGTAAAEISWRRGGGFSY